MLVSTKSTLKLAAALIVGSIALSGGAQAGGLFGEGGIFRGTVGQVLDKVENDVLTPVARGTAVVGGAAAGGVGALATGSDPRSGVAAGGMLGQIVNEGFKGSFGR